MRKGVLFFVVVMFGYLVKAQEHIPTKADYDAFKSTKTMVVMDVNPMSDFNFKIKDVMNGHWSLTEFEFITEQEFENMKGDPAYSFLVTTVVTFDKDKTKARYKFLSLLLGEDEREIRDMPDLCSVPLSYLRVDDDSYSYKLDAFVSFIQNHVKLMTENPNLIKANVFKYYNKNIKSLKNKTLLLVADDLEPTINTQKKIQKVYPHDVKIVTREEVMEAIERKDPDVVFLHKVGPEGTKYKARCYKILLGAADSQFYYFDYHMVSSKKRDYLLEKDLKKMASH